MDNLFRNLSPQEEAEFRSAARSEYQPLTYINPNWHPVYRRECVAINHKAYESIQKKKLRIL